MKEKGIFIVPTLCAPHEMIKHGKETIPPEDFKKAKEVLDNAYNNAGKAIQAGVKLSLGTEAGATNFQSLRVGGLGSAELLKIDHDDGSIEVGKFADFLVIDENPLEDVTAVLQRDKQVFQHGIRKK